MGSSPRIRGTHGPVGEGKTCRELTPAHTGNAARSSIQSISSWAHPRTYGGTLGHQQVPAQAAELTPAYTGNAACSSIQSISS